MVVYCAFFLSRLGNVYKIPSSYPFEILLKLRSSGVDKDLQVAPAPRPWRPHNHGSWSPRWILPGTQIRMSLFSWKSKEICESDNSDGLNILRTSSSLSWRKPVAGPPQQRADPGACARLRGEGQRPPPHGHQREGRPLSRPPPRLQEDFWQGELCLQTTQPCVWKVSL